MRASQGRKKWWELGGKGGDNEKGLAVLGVLVGDNVKGACMNV